MSRQAAPKFTEQNLPPRQPPRPHAARPGLAWVAERAAVACGLTRLLGILDLHGAAATARFACRLGRAGHGSARHSGWVSCPSPDGAGSGGSSSGPAPGSPDPQPVGGGRPPPGAQRWQRPPLRPRLGQLPVQRWHRLSRRSGGTERQPALSGYQARLGATAASRRGTPSITLGALPVSSENSSGREERPGAALRGGDAG